MTEAAALEGRLPPSLLVRSGETAFSNSGEHRLRIDSGRPSGDLAPHTATLVPQQARD